MNKLDRFVYRSLLKWNVHHRENCFKLDLEKLFLPIDIIKIAPKTIITSEKDMKDVLKFIYRHQSSISISASVGLSVLKILNDHGETLKAYHSQHITNSRLDINEFAIFKIGQVCQHNSIGFRCVVIGWEIAENNTQNVEILMDVTDVNEFIRDRSFAYMEQTRYISAKDLSLVNDEDLLRLRNDSIPQYFLRYDAKLRRYIPNNELLFRYPCDFDDVSKKALERAKRKYHSQNKDVIDLQNSHDRVNLTISQLNRHLYSIIKKYGISLLNPLNESIDQGGRDGYRRDTDYGVLSEIVLILGDIDNSMKLNKIVNSENYIKFSHLHHLQLWGNNEDDVNATNALNREKSNYVAYTALGHLSYLYTSIDHLLMLRFQHHGVGYLDGLLTLNKMDTSKFNRRSRTILKEEKSKIQDPTILPETTFSVGQIVRHKQFHYRGIILGWDKRPNTDVGSWEGVLRTKLKGEQPFYHVIADENDMEERFGSGFFRHKFYVCQENLELVSKSSTSTSTSTTSNLSHIIKHRDAKRFFKSYNAETNCYEMPQRMKFCFPSRDDKVSINSNDKNAASNVINDNDKDNDVMTERILLDMLSALKKSFSYTREEHSHGIAVHRGVHHSRIEMLKSPFFRNRDAKVLNKIDFDTSSSSNHDPMTDFENGSSLTAAETSIAEDVPILNMRDLFLLLRKAECQSDAANVDNIILNIFSSSRINDVNKLMRIGLCDLKRGSYKTATKMFNDVYLLDPSFIDPQVRLAALSNIDGNYTESIKWGKQALKISPQHYYALITLAASYENLHDKDEAERTYRRALMRFPWSYHATVLLRMIFNSKKPIPEFTKTE